ncbi:hypothetical protein BCD49_04310 [Pseudofrankia sp. EUN1h]|nr:hypothetical protein BCD49_04310 [Pseudofrankia sp. EUN1h]
MRLVKGETIFFIEELRQTATTQWCRSAHRSDNRARFYGRLDAALERRLRDAGPESLACQRLRQREVLGPKGDPSSLPKSTLNDLFGQSAADSLLFGIQRELRAALPYYDDVGRCSAELGVWTYAPYRDEWLTELTHLEEPRPRHAATALVWAVADWARHHHAVAAHLGFTPPVTAVEDLLVVSRGRLDAVTAVGLLTRVNRLAVTGELDRGGQVLGPVHDDLMSLAFDVVDLLPVVVDELRADLDVLLRIAGKLNPAGRGQVAEVLVPAFAEVMEVLFPTP